MNEIFHLLKFQELINELEKNVFHWEKKNCGPIGNSAHTTESFTKGKTLVILPLYLQNVYVLILILMQSYQNYTNTTS